MLLALLLAASGPVETPKAYIQRIYASYQQPNFNPLDHPDRYFTPDLAAAMREDARLAKGEVGYVDGDPICQCQDPGGLRARILRMVRQTASKAVAIVLLDYPDSTARRVRFSLVRTKLGWRIADVSSAGEPSFLRAILASNSRARSRR